MGALLYGASPVCALCAIKQIGHLNVRGVFRHYVPRKGLHPLRCESSCPHNEKAWRGHAFPVLLSYEHLANVPGLLLLCSKNGGK